MPHHAFEGFLGTKPCAYTFQNRFPITCDALPRLHMIHSAAVGLSLGHGKLSELPAARVHPMEICAEPWKWRTSTRKWRKWWALNFLTPRPHKTKFISSSVHPRLTDLYQDPPRSVQWTTPHYLEASRQGPPWRVLV